VDRPSLAPLPLVAAFLATLVCPPRVARPEPTAAGPRGLATSDWRLESVTLADGRRIDGLVEDPDPDTGDVRVVQVVRPPGRPMYVVRWPPLQADRLGDVVRLPAAEHAELARRVHAFLDDRRRRESAEMAVGLRRDHEDGPWRYEGDAFLLTSTADSQVTRSAVVAIEQILGGLQTLVPAGDRPPRARITVRLCGSGAEYRQAQRDLGVGIDSPAFYVPVRGLIVAGGDLPAIAAAAAAEEATLAATAQGFERLDAVLEQRVRSLAAELESRGVGPRERADVVRRTRLRWEREQTAERDRITAARRANDARLKRAWEAFRRRLAHETWHAYADTRLRDHDSAGLPIWLDEGLAQVVESAPLEAGELRLDAPDPDRLADLQAVIRDGTAPAIVDVLRAGQERFIGGHGVATADRGRAYLAAWGLALDVAMLRPVLARDGVAQMTADDDPLAAFEAMVGLPVDRYESDWRRRILALRPGRRSEAEPPGDVTPVPSPAASPARSPPGSPSARPDR
jgi:hypothetical protein